MASLRRSFKLVAGRRDLDRGRPAHRHPRPSAPPGRAGLQPHQLRRPGLRPAGAAGGAPRAVVRERARPDPGGACAALRVDQHRPDLRPAQADPRVVRAHDRAGGRAATRSHRAVRLRPPAGALQAAAPHHPERPAAGRAPHPACWAARSPASSAAATPTSAWTTSRCRATRLSAARRQGRLHRNFQGYSTQPDCDLIGLGVSSIGRMGATYSQNAKTLPEYYDAVRQGQFPVVRGLALTREDLLRRAVIMALMCQGRVEFESIELAHLIKMREHFAPELERLQPMVEGGLVEITDERHPGHGQRLVLRARRGHGVRPAPADRPGAGALFAHHLGRGLRSLRQRPDARPGRRAALHGDVRRGLRGRGAPRRQRHADQLPARAHGQLCGWRARWWRPASGCWRRWASGARRCARCGRLAHAAALGLGLWLLWRGRQPAWLENLGRGAKRQASAPDARGWQRMQGPVRGGCGRQPVGRLALRAAAERRWWWPRWPTRRRAVPR